MSVKAAQLHNTLSSLTPVPEVIHNSHPSQYHQPHIHPGHAPGSGAGGPVDHLHHLDGQGHNFSVDSLMTAQQQHQQMAASDSREGSPNSAEEAGAPSAPNYRNSAVSAAMASWSSNCSQYPVDEQGHMIDEQAHQHNYRAWYAIPPAGSPQMTGADSYHQSTTPPTTSAPGGMTGTPARESYAAAAAAAAAYRSHLFNYNQECNGPITSEVPQKY